MRLNVEKIRNLRPQNELHYFETIGSTMTEAARLAAAGAPHGTIILAEEQTAGMGRLGRSWQSDAELGIYCSILLRLPVQPGTLAGDQPRAWARDSRSDPEINSCCL